MEGLRVCFAITARRNGRRLLQWANIWIATNYFQVICQTKVAEISCIFFFAFASHNWPDKNDVTGKQNPSRRVFTDSKLTDQPCSTCIHFLGVRGTFNTPPCSSLPSLLGMFYFSSFFHLTPLQPFQAIWECQSACGVTRSCQGSFHI